jgi:CBS domain-containing protein
VQTCAPDADVHQALAIMRRAKVRRLPVVANGKLEGILALNDLVLAAERRPGGVDYEEVMNTLKAVSEHRGHKPAVSSVAPTVWPPIPVAVA